MRKVFTLYVLFTLLVSAQAQVPVLWGTATQGGTHSSGTIFNLHGDGSNFNVGYNFGTIGANDGNTPTGNLVQGPNGVLYGMTEGGGANENGMVYSYDPNTNTYADLWDFSAAEFASPWGGLVLANNGLMYGMTFGDGTNGAGNIFSVDTFGTYTDVYDMSFSDASGCFPYGSLIQGQNGLLYGMTSTAGTNGDGSIFSFNPATLSDANPPTTLYSWDGGTDGGFPYIGSSLVQGSNGLLYGMTNSGGSGASPSCFCGNGVVFSIDTLGATYNVLWPFDGSPYGTPMGSLVQAGGFLYGMTNGNNCGCGNGGDLFSIDTTSTNLFPFNDLEDFTTSTGDNPASINGSLNVASDGNIYGATTDDGTSGGSGEVFQYNYNTFSYSPLYNLSAANGTRPFANFLELRTISTSITGSTFCAGRAVNVHFTATGAYLIGNVFTAQLSNSSGSFASPVTLGTFSGTSGGSFTINGTIPGGTATGSGYRIRIVSSGPNFTGTDNGSNLTINTCAPVGGSQLWGTTSAGGVNGNGVIYSVNEDGSNYTVHYAFPNPALGANPYGSLVKATDGKLYGMTLGGGANLSGTVYSIDPQSNAYADLVDFNYASFPEGATPYGGLIQASNGVLYGMTYDGGAGGPPDNIGAFFSYDPSTSTYVDLYNFVGPNMGNPWANGVIQATDGKLYGLTYGDVYTPGLGSIFSFDPTTPGNPPVDLYDFTDAAPDYSYWPHGSLVQATMTTGLLYGMTIGGGATNTYGNIFSFDLTHPANPAVDVYDFTDASPDFSIGPWGSLMQASNGLLYGLSLGGANGDGNIFSFDPTTGSVTDLFDFTGTGGPGYGTSPYGSLMQAANGQLYGWTNIGGTYNNGVIFTYDYTTNTYTDLRDLDGNPDGSFPWFGSFAEVPPSTINVWLGGTTDWNTTTNWSLGTVPACADIEDSIPVTAHDPVISVAENASNLVIDDNVTLTVNAALSVCGNLTGGSTRFATIQGTTALTLTGTALQTIAGKLAFQNPLALDNTFGTTPQAELSAGAAVNIYDAVVLQNDNTLDASLGTLTLKSTSVTQAGIIDNFSGSNSGTVTGNITAERFYGAAPAANDFKQHMLGSPVSGINLSALGSSSGSSAYYIAATGGIHNCNELLGESGTPYGNVFSYDETHANLCTMDGWKVGAASTAVSAGTGYSVVLGNGSGTIHLTGAANLSSSYSVPTTNTGYANTTSDQGRVYSSGINLVSNPYSATLNVSSLNTANSGNFSSQTVYVWNVTTGSYDMNPATIAPFQAFKVIQSAAGGSSYTIPGSSRTTTAGTFQRTANPVELNMTVTNNSTGLTDNTVVGFNPNSTAQFNAVNDVIKLPGALTRHTLYTLNSSYWLAVNTLNSISETSTVAVGFEPGVSGTYTANFSGLTSFDPTSYITLEDLQLGIMHDVRSGDYIFTSDAGDNFNRFVLHFTPPASINTTNATCSEQGMINIVQPGTAIWNYMLADNNNVILSSGTLNSASPVTASLPAGVYTLTLVDNNSYTVVKTVQVNGVQPVLASFTASANSVNVNQEVSLSSTAAGAVFNTWNFGDGTTDNGATVSHAYANEGVYNVTLNSTSASGCNSSASNTITVTRSVTGVTDLNDINNILIWSNENIVNVDFTQLKDVQANIEIYNILGQKLYEDKYVTSAVYHKEIPNIEEGYIVVSVKNNDTIITKKLFISNAK